MIIELSEKELELLIAKLPELAKYKQESFADAIRNHPIHELIGKSFPDQEGIFAGMMNNVYYFVESLNVMFPNGTMEWNDAMEFVDRIFYLPTKDELMFLYVNKELFNKNCQEGEKWLDVEYWTSSEEHTNNTAWHIHLRHGIVINVNKNILYSARGVRKVVI